MDARFRLLTSDLTPYLALGLGLGWNTQGVRALNVPGAGLATYDFSWLLMARTSVGVEYHHPTGLTFRFAANYEVPLRSDFQLLSSSSDAVAQGLQRTYDPGLGFSCAVGWRF